MLNQFISIMNYTFYAKTARNWVLLLFVLFSFNFAAAQCKCEDDCEIPVVDFCPDISVSIPCTESCGIVVIPLNINDPCKRFSSFSYNFKPYPEYMCLSPGTYTFTVKGVRSKDGIEILLSCITVTIRQEDSRPPVIECPQDVVVTAECGQSCAKATWGDPKVYDECDPNPYVICDWEKDHCFPIGTTRVWYLAFDSEGNMSKCGFNVTVKPFYESKPPTITCPKDQVVYVECDEKCTKVDLPITTAKDNCDPNPTIRCDYKKDFCFPVGTTVVTCYAKDYSGNETKCTYNVIVKQKPDIIAPKIKCRNDVDLYVECGYKCSRMMMWMDPEVSDNCDPSPKVTCSLTNKNYCFPLGKTVITCYAEDKAGNKSECSYTVTVKESADYTPPTITCPADIMKTLTGRNMCEKVEFATPTAKDLCDKNVKVTCDYASGYCFPMGKTKVTCKAVDKSGNEATCFFYVTVMSTGDLVKAVDTNPIADAPKTGDKREDILVENEAMLNFTLPTSQNIKRKNFTLYPNPTENFVMLELADYKGTQVIVQIVNAMGQHLQSLRLKDVSEQAYKMDMQDLSSGIYFIKVIADGIEPQSKKVMKK
jgi:hypothetical protein